MSRADRRAGIEHRFTTMAETVAHNLAVQRLEEAYATPPAEPDLERVAFMAQACMRQSHQIREHVKRQNMTNMIAAAMASQSRL